MEYQQVRVGEDLFKGTWSKHDKKYFSHNWISYILALWSSEFCSLVKVTLYFPKCCLISTYPYVLLAYPQIMTGVYVDFLLIYASCEQCALFLYANLLIKMMTSSNGNIFRVTGPLCGELTGEFPSQRPLTRNFDVFFDMGLNKRLSKQYIRRWFETPSLPLWRW